MESQWCLKSPLPNNLNWETNHHITKKKELNQRIFCAFQVLLCSVVTHRALFYPKQYLSPNQKFIFSPKLDWWYRLLSCSNEHFIKYLWNSSHRSSLTQGVPLLTSANTLDCNSLAFNMMMNLTVQVTRTENQCSKLGGWVYVKFQTWIPFYSLSFVLAFLETVSAKEIKRYWLDRRPWFKHRGHCSSAWNDSQASLNSCLL